MALKEAFVNEFKEAAKGCTFRAIPLTELTHDELLAVCSYSFRQISEDRERHMRDINFLSELRGTRCQ